MAILQESWRLSSTCHVGIDVIKKKQIAISIGDVGKDIEPGFDIHFRIHYGANNIDVASDIDFLRAGTVELNPTLDESSKLLFLNDALDITKDIYLSGRYVPKISNDLPLFWLTGLSQKKPSKTKVVAAYEYAKSIDYLLKKSKGMLAGSSIILICPDFEIEKVLSNFLSKKKCDYGFSYVKPKRNFNHKLLSGVRPAIKLAVSVLAYFKFLFYINKNMLRKKKRTNNVNKKILAVVDNDWELRLNDGCVDSMYWPNLSDKAKNHGYTIVWLPLIRLKDANIRKNVESILASEAPGMKISIAEIFSHFQHLFLNILFLLRKGGVFKSCVISGVDLGSIIKVEAQNVVLSGSLKNSLFYSLIKSAGKNTELAIERKPFNALGRVLLYACDQIPVIGIQHGIVNNSQLGYLFTSVELDTIPRTQRYDRCQVPDVLAVFGERILDRMVANNYRKEWLSILGDMKFNSADYVSTMPEKFSVKKCMFVLQYDEKFLNRWLPVVAETILGSRAEKAHLVIKPHPQDVGLGNAGKNLLVSLGYNKNLISVSTEPFVAAVDNVDVIVSHSSTAIIEALYRAKPVLLISDNCYENDNSLFQSLRCCFPFSDAFGLSESLRKLENISVDDWDAARKEFLAYNLENIRSDPYRLFFELCDAFFAGNSDAKK